MIYLAYGLAWVATGAAVSIGIYITKSAWCLWALVFPLFISFSVKQEDK